MSLQQYLQSLTLKWDYTLDHFDKSKLKGLVLNISHCSLALMTNGALRELPTSSTPFLYANILCIFFSICVVVEQFNSKSNLQFSVCTATFLEQKHLISSTTVLVWVVNSGATKAPTSIIQIRMLCKHFGLTCTAVHRYFWPRSLFRENMQW